ncbi:hypothetical protein D3C86_2009740 [compost metagenome]
MDYLQEKKAEADRKGRAGKAFEWVNNLVSVPENKYKKANSIPSIPIYTIPIIRENRIF